jgi:hypothetical protein
MSTTAKIIAHLGRDATTMGAGVLGFILDWEVETCCTREAAFAALFVTKSWASHT